jgi:hypothetical protein
VPRADAACGRLLAAGAAWLVAWLHLRKTAARLQVQLNLQEALHVQAGVSLSKRQPLPGSPCITIQSHVCESWQVQQIEPWPCSQSPVSTNRNLGVTTCQHTRATPAERACTLFRNMSISLADGKSACRHARGRPSGTRDRLAAGRWHAPRGSSQACGRGAAPGWFEHTGSYLHSLSGEHAPSRDLGSTHTDPGNRPEDRQATGCPANDSQPSETVTF